MSDGERRNVVLVTADSLRADHCGFVNPDSELTPTIDRLAGEGTAFTQAIAPGPRTPSSVPVLFTGEFMADDEDWRMEDWQRRQQRIGRHVDRFMTLTERLERRGYDTAAFTANPWTTRESNFDGEFDAFYEISADSDDISSRRLSDSRLFKLADTTIDPLPADPFDWSWKKEWFSQWTGYFDLIEDQLDELSEPFFLWVFVMDTHQPYITPGQFREESSAWEMYYSILRYWQDEVSGNGIPRHAREMISRTYRDAVRSVDAFVDDLTEEVASYDPVTVLLSDHGEALGEHDNFGHEQELFEENVHVPFLVHDDRSVASDVDRVDDQVPLQSLAELLLDVAEPETFDPGSYAEPFAVSKIESNQKTAVRTSRWKLISNGGTDRLYDLQSDPEESRDVLGSHSEVASSLRAILDRHGSSEREKASLRTGTAELLEDNHDPL